MLLRFAMNLYKGKIEGEAFTNQIFRESSALRASADVWSDVASTMGLGFRYGDAGPLLHGELPGGGALEVGVYEGKVDGQYRTVARAKASAVDPLAGSVVVRSHTPATRALARLFSGPANVPEELRRHFFVRADPDERAGDVLGAELAGVLLEQLPRRPSLYAEHGEVTLVLDGIELVHEHLERIVTALDRATSDGRPAPYR